MMILMKKGDFFIWTCGFVPLQQREAEKSEGFSNWLDHKLWFIIDFYKLSCVRDQFKWHLVLPCFSDSIFEYHLYFVSIFMHVLKVIWFKFRFSTRFQFFENVLLENHFRFSAISLLG